MLPDIDLLLLHHLISLVSSRSSASQFSSTKRDIVVSVVRREELYQYGSGSTWCLLVLTLAAFVFLWMAIRHTDLLTPDESQHRWGIPAYRRCAMTLIAACVVLLVCVVEIQLISTVDQSKESTASSVT